MVTTYSTIVATRNRPEALALSLPLILTQTRLPEAVLVVDSSDDPRPNAELVARMAAGAKIPVTHRTSAPSLPFQRNIGMAGVTSNVIMFPDDDSLLYPDAMEHMMRIYDLDVAGQVGGVRAADTRSAPPGVLNAIDRAGGPTYKMRPTDRIKTLIARPRHRLEAKLFPDPFAVIGDRMTARIGAMPEALAAEGAVTIPWMTGYRMSFRTPLIHARGFNQKLGRYALFEDIDASLGILQGGHLLIGAPKAKIFHHKAPDRRANGATIGAMHVLNRAYVVARTGETDPATRRITRRYLAYKIAQYASGAMSEFGRERLAGARAAYRGTTEILTAPPENLDATYLRWRAQLIHER
ncbi:MAG TPA: glycosyltransferase [Albidovulum sp.]|uniref:glycosyltransferase family 2 protein n=1 Tax=Albidovulum sp. TaxID=1872424 RepID=UPI002C7982A1|nr:glycosyltransferase [Albidovulum sp.]